MPNYRRAKITGATWFFTVNLLERHNNNLLIKEIALLKTSIKHSLCWCGDNSVGIEVAD